MSIHAAMDEIHTAKKLDGQTDRQTVCLSVRPNFFWWCGSHPWLHGSMLHGLAQRSIAMSSGMTKFIFKSF